MCGDRNNKEMSYGQLEDIQCPLNGIKSTEYTNDS